MSDSAADDYVGAAACAACHRVQHDAWKDSTHGKAGGPPGTVELIAPFDGEPIRFADAVVRPTTRSDGRAAFIVEWLDAAPQTFIVEGVVGGGHMAGGGTQGFFTRKDDGTLRFLPFDYSGPLGRWFCRSQPDGRWLPISADRPLGSCTDWPPRRTMGAIEGATGCDQCHGSQIRTRFLASTRRWVTEYNSLAIDCESCHGPARRHVELAQAGRIGDSADIGLTALATLTKRESVAVCLQCHGEKIALQPGTTAIAPPNLEDRYSLMLPILTDPPYTPDFRHKKFGYQGPHLASVCFVDGTMTCADCHDPHSQSYRDDLWRPLQGRLDDGQCTSCHPSKRENVAAHTYHAVTSPGSRCVACHMPYLQHPSVGDAIPYARADHSVSVPRPAPSENFGLSSACAGCHASRPAADLARQAETWWGTLKPRHPLIDAVIRVAGPTTVEHAGLLLLRPDLDAPLLQFAALTQYYLRFTAVDGGVRPESDDRALRVLAASSDVDVAALALATLWVADGARPSTAAFVRARLSPGSRSLLRAKTALGYLAWVQQLAGRVDRAVAILRKVRDLTPEDPALLADLAGLVSQSGDVASALSLLSASAKIDPDRVMTHMVSGFTLEKAGDLRGALSSYGRAVDLNPWDPVALFRLALVRLQLSDFAGAEQALVRAIDLDASNVQAGTLLARLLVARGARDQAESRLRMVLSFDAGNREALELQRRMSERP